MSFNLEFMGNTAIYFGFPLSDPLGVVSESRGGERVIINCSSSLRKKLGLGGGRVLNYKLCWGETGWGISFAGLGALVPHMVGGLYADLQLQNDRERVSGNCVFNDHAGDSELHLRTRVPGRSLRALVPGQGWRRSRKP